MTRRPARRQHVTGSVRAPPTKSGDLVNADRLIVQSDDPMGLTGDRDAHVIVDRYSGYIDVFP